MMNSGKRFFQEVKIFIKYDSLKFLSFFFIIFIEYNENLKNEDYGVPNLKYELCKYFRAY
jgi:hypothetical protein